jgi:hypothetical protein
MEVKKIISLLAIVFSASGGSATLVSLAMAGFAPNEFALSFAVWISLLFPLTFGVAATIGLGWHSIAMSRNWRGVFVYLIPGMSAGLAIPTTLFAMPAILAGQFVGATPPFFTVVAITIGIASGGLTGLLLGSFVARTAIRRQARPRTTRRRRLPRV